MINCGMDVDRSVARIICLIDRVTVLPMEDQSTAHRDMEREILLGATVG
jgi:hypothetical protein